MGREAGRMASIGRVILTPGIPGPVSTVPGPPGPPGLSVVPFSTKSGNYTLTADDQAITVDATAAARTITLPTAASVPGKVYSVSKSDASANPVIIAPVGGSTIDGLASHYLVFQYQYLMFVSDGTNWRVMASNYHGKELGYSQVNTGTIITNNIWNDAGLYSNRIAGMSITVVGAGRPVAIEFAGQGYHSVANSWFGASLLTNGSAVNGERATQSNPSTTNTRDILLRKRVVLDAGTSYTFEIGLCCQSGGAASMYADSASPSSSNSYLSVVGQ